MHDHPYLSSVARLRFVESQFEFSQTSVPRRLVTAADVPRMLWMHVAYKADRHLAGVHIVPGDIASANHSPSEAWMGWRCARWSLCGIVRRGRRGDGHESVFGGHVVLVRGTTMASRGLRWAIFVGGGRMNPDCGERRGRLKGEEERLCAQKGLGPPTPRLRLARLSSGSRSSSKAAEWRKIPQIGPAWQAGPGLWADG